MNVLRKGFLMVVGAISVAYEEAAKSVKQQQKKLNGRFNRKAA